jgi:hypothetical protein
MTTDPQQVFLSVRSPISIWVLRCLPERSAFAFTVGTASAKCRGPTSYAPPACCCRSRKRATYPYSQTAGAATPRTDANFWLIRAGGFLLPKHLMFRAEFPNPLPCHETDREGAHCCAADKRRVQCSANAAPQRISPISRVEHASGCLPKCAASSTAGPTIADLFLPRNVC